MADRKNSWHRDGFVAEASHYDLDLHRVSYPANPEVADFAEEALGKGDWASLFAYLYRRFGPPNAGSDDHNEIACWHLTTPMEGVHLRISVKPISHHVNFFLEATRTILDAVVHKASERRLAMLERMEQWSMTKFGEPVPGLREDLEALRLHDKDRYDDVVTRMNEREAAYHAEHPDDRIGLLEEKDSDLLPMIDAGKRAVQDLLRVVEVRDNDINALGKVDGSKYPPAEYCAHAGRWLPFYAYSEDMTDVIMAAESLGGGQEGMSKVAAIVRREVPETGEGALQRATAILRRMVEVAPPDGNARPHPSEYWTGIISARKFLNSIEGDAS